VVSNGATAVKGAWSEAEGVHRSEAETLDGKGSGVARLFVGSGRLGFLIGFLRAERAGGCRVGARGACGIETAGGEAPQESAGFVVYRFSFFLG
jgi:hypothetical protein